MTPDLLDLARKLAARPEWRWRPGMRLRSRGGNYWRRVVAADSVHAVLAWEQHLGDEADCTIKHKLIDLRGAEIDITDPATAGCLLAMVPGLRTVVRRDDPLGWAVRYADPQDGAECWVSTTLWCPTLGEACARALLAAWGAR
jgi:hypothetical protein